MKKHWLIVLMVLVGTPCISQDLPDLGDSSRSVLSATQEKKLGESIIRQLRKSPSYIHDPHIRDYLNELGYRLIVNSSSPGGDYRFFAIDASSVNAFALPGGFIGVHTGLILAVQNESELASVLAHEIAHVTQRHIARMLAARKLTGFASFAALAVAILATRSNVEAAQTALAASQASVLHTQLNFTREYEKEADRIGVGILEASGFDVGAMATFLEKMQKISSLYDVNVPSYLRTHPLNVERLADVQHRVRERPYRQIADSEMFHFIRARLEADQGASTQAIRIFRTRLSDGAFINEAAARYGYALALFRGGEYQSALAELEIIKDLTDSNPMTVVLEGKIYIKLGDINRGLLEFTNGLRDHPNRLALTYGYAEALIMSGRSIEAVQFLSKQIFKNGDDPKLFALQAEAYAASGDIVNQYRAQSEVHFLQGNLKEAIEQLRLAQGSGEGDFYELSSIEARIKELEKFVNQP